MFKSYVLTQFLLCNSAIQGSYAAVMMKRTFVTMALIIILSVALSDATAPQIRNSGVCNVYVTTEHKCRAIANADSQRNGFGSAGDWTFVGAPPGCYIYTQPDKPDSYNKYHFNRNLQSPHKCTSVRNCICTSFANFCANPNDYDGNYLIPKWNEEAADHTCDFWLKYLSDRSHKIDLRNPTCAMINTPIIHSDGRNTEPNLRDYLWRLSPCCGGDISNVFSWKNVDAKFAKAKLWKKSRYNRNCIKKISGSDHIPVSLWLPGKKENEVIVSNQYMCNTESPYHVSTYNCESSRVVQNIKTCKTANCDEFKDPSFQIERSGSEFNKIRNGECVKINHETTTLGFTYSKVNNVYKDLNLCPDVGDGGIFVLILILCFCCICGIGVGVYFLVTQNQKQSSTITVQAQMQPSSTLQMVPQNQEQMVSMASQPGVVESNQVVEQSQQKQPIQG